MEMKKLRSVFKLQGKGLRAWKDAYKAYSQHVNKLLKTPEKERAPLVKQSPYFTGEAGSLVEHQLAFMYTHKLVSIYSLKNVEEWFAENYSCCIYTKLFPNSSKSLRSIELEHLLGINPHAAISSGFCDSL